MTLPTKSLTTFFPV